MDISPGFSKNSGIVNELFTLYSALKHVLLKYDQDKYYVDLLIDNAGGDMLAIDREHCEVAYDYCYNLVKEYMPKIKKMVNNGRFDFM